MWRALLALLAHTQLPPQEAHASQKTSPMRFCERQLPYTQLKQPILTEPTATTGAHTSSGAACGPDDRSLLLMLLLQTPTSCVSQLCGGACSQAPAVHTGIPIKRVSDTHKEPTPCEGVQGCM